MRNPSQLLIKMFEHNRWQALLDKAEEKQIPIDEFKELYYPTTRQKLFDMIWNDEYVIDPPHIAKIPKDEPGKFREVYINESIDRIVLALINDVLCEMFPEFVHKNCVSYQKGIGTQKVVKEVSGKIYEMSKNTNIKEIGWKIDFSKYFDNVQIWAIEDVFGKIEKRLGFEKGTEPVLNLLRRYYLQDEYFDEKRRLCSRYQGLKQGCAVASFLANAVLYELDEKMSQKYPIYYRYSDDAVIIGNNTDNAIKEMNEIIEPYGVSLNPNKVERLYVDKWFKFLGFNIKKDSITLSARRVKTFQKEIEKRSIKRKKCTSKQARRAIIQYLYEGEHCWATSCLGTINVEPDIQELNKFVLDCIRACETGKKKIGGLGSNTNLLDRTIMRGRGKNVKANRDKTGYIEDFISVGCCSNTLKISRKVFEATIHNLAL